MQASALLRAAAPDAWRDLAPALSGLLETDEPAANESEPAAYSTTVAEEVFWGGEPLFVRDALSDERLSRRQSVLDLELRTVVCVPLAARERSLGVIYLDRTVVTEAFTELDLEVVTALAAQTAGALLAIRERGESAHRIRVTETLLEAARGMLAADTRTAAALAVEAALKLVPAERGFIVLAGEGDRHAEPTGHASDPGGSGREPAAGEEPPALEILRGRDAALAPLEAGPADLSQGIARWVLASGEAVSILDAAEDETWQRQQSVLALSLRAVLGIPLRVGGAVRGLLYLDSRDQATVFGPDHLESARRIAALLEAKLG